MKTASAFLVTCLTAATALASSGPPLDPGEGARGAKKVVLATVTDVQAAFGENDYGDRLILSQVTLRADETMKGPHEPSIVVTIEGGTVGELTLAVSDMPTMEKGQRAVLFLTSSANGRLIPYRRGSGVMNVEADDRITGTGLTVDDIRAAVKQGGNQ